MDEALARNKFMAKKLNEEAALVFLSTMLMRGKEYLDSSDETSWNASDCTLELFSKVKDDKFFQPFFVTSMKVTLSKIFVTEVKTGADSKETMERSLDRFLVRLKEIFPDYFAKKLFAFVGSKLEENIEWLIYSMEEVRENRKYADSVFNGSLITGQQSSCPVGTNTRLVPCPQCKLNKRCDAKTKHFRCKCGFDKPYPFA